MLGSLIVSLLVASAGAIKYSPVEKVLQMMGDMKTKALKEKQNELVGFTKFKAFCENTESSKAGSIQDGKDAAEQLAADIQKSSSDAKVLGEEITKLGSSVDQATADKASAVATRAAELADYKKVHAETVENVADLQAALGKIKEMMAKAPGASAASLLQQMANDNDDLLTPHTRRYLTAFISERSGADFAMSEGIDSSAPEAAAFETQSGGIVGMMEELEEKLIAEKAAIEAEEMNKQQAHNMMVQSLTSEITMQTDAIAMKTTQKKKAEEDAAKAKGDLADTEATLAEDEKYLSDLQAMCTQKSQEFEIRSKLRAEEMEALDEAIEIITSKVSGAASEHLGLTQKKTTSLVQLRSSSQQPTQRKAAAFLAEQGAKLHSNLLSALAVRANSDPFGKVRKMIKDMVAKLMEEANEEADHKAFCDAEMSTNKQTRDMKTTAIAELKASIEELTSESQKLAGEITDIAAQVTAIDAAVSEAVSDRNDEKAKNTKTIADSKDAKTAVESALAVLKEFYEKAADPATHELPPKGTGPISYDDRAIAILHKSSGGASFIQKGSTVNQGPADDAPDTFEGPFTGTGDAGGGIMGMMEVIVSDFERLETETTEAEFTAAKEHDAFMADSSEDKAVKEADSKNKVSSLSRVKSDLQTAHKDLRITTEELDAAMAYYEKLKPSCVEEVMSYAERKAAREAEINSLKEALEILSGENI
jgi:hypothetical protein